ncbi:hypothetical protein HanPSC8_Chr01g0002041 [Helianthus annuus]|nr:hypothetical protein HanPSC8_Chr01g0002041 [Helianthus annuus]
MELRRKAQAVPSLKRRTIKVSSCLHNVISMYCSSILLFNG